jgi:hypothetical protein
MLTRNDATVENALDLVEIARELGIRNISSECFGEMLRRLKSFQNRPFAISTHTSECITDQR